MKTHLTIQKLLVVLMVSTIFCNTKLLAQPVNDLIENAIDLGYGPLLFSQSDVDFPEATTMNDGGQQGCSTGVAGIWYKFTATAVGEVGAGIFSPSTPIIVFYSAPNNNATSGQELTHVDQVSNPCDNGNFSVIQTTIGTTYYIFMKNNTLSDIHINTEEIFAIPENDLIENAINLNGLEDYFDSDVHFLLATNDGDNGQTACDTDPVKAVWYKFTATIDGQVVAGIDVAPAGGGMVFFTAANENVTSGSELTWVDQASNPCGPNNLSSIDAVAGTTYYIMAGKIGAFAGGYSDVSINLSGILGIEDSLIAGFSFYPNPVSTELSLSAKNSIDTIQVFNLLGQKVVSEKIGATQGQINLSHLRSGMYVLQITSEGKTGSYKILKQ